jgi:hypothetical protein
MELEKEEINNPICYVFFVIFQGHEFIVFSIMTHLVAPFIVFAPTLSIAPSSPPKWKASCIRLTM